MANFVLVHGAMHGGWCWREVDKLLTAQGHSVFTPTLSGQGDRRHELSPHVGIDTHVDNICELLWFEDLTDVTLVFHSYAGVLAGPVADRAGERLKNIVYLAAFITADGECLLDAEPPEVAATYKDLIKGKGDGWYIPSSPAFLDQWNIKGKLRDFIAPRLTDFPGRCAQDQTVFDEAKLAKIPKSYVYHTNPPLPSLKRSYEIAKTNGWQTTEIASCHDMMLADPKGTTDLLLKLS